MIRKIFLSAVSMVLVLAICFLASRVAFAAGGPGEGGDSVAPAAPTGLGASGNTSGINLSWSAVTTNADGTAISDLNDYRVWRSTSSGSGFSAVATVSSSTGTSYSDTSIAADIIFYYKVTARDSSQNESAQSSETNGFRRRPSDSGLGSPSGSPSPQDQTPPQNTSVLISRGDPTVSTTTVTLTLAASDATEMKISNYPTFSDGVWVAYAVSLSWKLLPGDGVKIVYVQFRDSAANVSAAVSDTIILTGTGLASTVVQTSVPVSSTTIAGTTPAPNKIAPPLTFAFTRRFAIGAQGDDVKKLQAYLAGNKDLYPEGLVSGHYGSLTQKAVQRFQEKYGIAKPGDPGYGEVGPATRAKLNALAGGVTAPVTPQATQQSVSPIKAPVLSSQFTKRLQMGMQDEEVRNLQKVLGSDSDVYPEGIITGYYGSLTVKAVQRFQEKYGIAKPGDPGYGEVGPKTRAKLNNPM